jgi:peptidoglycan/xylan/chitin deacetylase (PgdA/CDA1 family)
VKNPIILFLTWALEISGINALFRFLNRHKAIILMYHGICDDDFNLLIGYDDRQLPVYMFKKQIDYLKRKGYRFSNISDMVSSVNAGEKLDKSVVLTFDDGLRNNHRNAYQIMKNTGARGCLYLVSDLIGEGKIIWTDYVETVIRNNLGSLFQFYYEDNVINYNLNDNESSQAAMMDIKQKLRQLPDKDRHEHLAQFYQYELKEIPREFDMLTWEQIRQLDQNILEIGSHTRRHPNCENLISDDEMKDEILDSKTDIEENTGYQVRHFCYPAGSYNNRVIEKVKEYGYESAVSTDYGFVDNNSDLYKLERMEATLQLSVFKARISGSYGFFRRIKASFTSSQ